MKSEVSLSLQASVVEKKREERSEKEKTEIAGKRYVWMNVLYCMYGQYGYGWTVSTGIWYLSLMAGTESTDS